MTRLPDVPAGVRLLPDARLYQVWEPGPSMALVASFSALESAVAHIQWMIRNDPMQRLTLDILPPVEVRAPCQVCGDDLMVSLATAKSILAGGSWVEHPTASKGHHRVLAIVGS